MAPLIPNLGTLWRSVVDFKPQLLCPSKEPWNPMNRGLDRLTAGVNSFRGEKNILPL